MTTPDAPDPDDASEADTRPSPRERAPGVELGLSDDGGTFEPEEDPDDAGGPSA